MTRRILKPLVCLLLVLFPFTEVGAQDEGPRIRVVWTTKPPVIVGVLDEAVWEGAALLGPLTQATPRLGEAPTQRERRDHMARGLYPQGRHQLGFGVGRARHAEETGSARMTHDIVTPHNILTCQITFL